MEERVSGFFREDIWPQAELMGLLLRVLDIPKYCHAFNSSLPLLREVQHYHHVPRLPLLPSQTAV